MVYAGLVSLLFLGAFVGSLAVIATMLSAYWTQMRVSLRNAALLGTDTGSVARGYDYAPNRVGPVVSLSVARVPVQPAHAA